MKNRYRISPDIRKAVYCTATAEGPTSNWEFLWAKLQTEEVAAERWSILHGLGCTRNKDDIKKYNFQNFEN